MCLAGWWAGGGEVNETLLRGLAHSGCPSVTGSGEGKRADPGAGAGGGRPGRQAGPSPVRVHLRESVGGVALEGKSRGRQESARGGGGQCKAEAADPQGYNAPVQTLSRELGWGQRSVPSDDAHKRCTRLPVWVGYAKGQ